MMPCMIVANETSSLSGSFTPRLTVAECWLSASISKTFLPCRTSDTPKLTLVMVLPVPPFLLVTAKTLPILVLLVGQIDFSVNETLGNLRLKILPRFNWN